jgi:serine/threonine protein kinase
MGCFLSVSEQQHLYTVPVDRTEHSDFNTKRSTFFVDTRNHLWKVQKDESKDEILSCYRNNVTIKDMKPHSRILKPLSVIHSKNSVITSMNLGSSDLFNIIHERFDWDFIRNELVHLADAIHFLHKNGVAHRDIKPENIILYQGHLRWIDWDFCYPLSNRVYCGTVDFMCPRTVSSEWNCSASAFSRKMDVYAFGKLIFAIFWQAAKHEMLNQKRFILHAFHCDCLTKRNTTFSGTWSSWANIAMLCISRTPPESIPIYLAQTSTGATDDVIADLADLEVLDADESFA